MPILLKVFLVTEREETFPNSFWEAKITLLPKPGKDKATTKKKTIGQGPWWT
jgi:hypothetical protein